jgi:hypothetical protein
MLSQPALPVMSTTNLQRGRRGLTESQVGGLAGLLGAALLAIYFTAPFAFGWPADGASASTITDYAVQHQALFFGGAWLLVTGTLFCVVLFLAIVHLARAAADLLGLVTCAATAVLLATVVIEAVCLVAVPIAATAGDTATSLTMFTLSNGVFVRVYAFAPATATLIGLGVVIVRSGVVARGIGWSALLLGIAFEAAGVISIWSSAGVVATEVLAAGQSLWVIAAAVDLLRRGGAGRSSR